MAKKSQRKRKSDSRLDKGTEKDQELSSLWSRARAIVCADLHLSLRPPVARSVEPDWLNAQQRILYQLSCLCTSFDAPLLIAGDIFHHWDAPAELINFAIKEFLRFDYPIYTIPGQHDLPNHNLEDIKRSAYWTLVEAQAITNVQQGYPAQYDDDIHDGPGSILHIYGYPWGVKSHQITEVRGGDLVVALAHAHCGTPKTIHHGAPITTLIDKWLKHTRGYHAVIIGDNHVPCQKGNIFVPGGLQRRRFDEIDHYPRVGILLHDGSIHPYQLDCSKDLFAEKSEAFSAAENLDMEGLLEELSTTYEKGLNFIDQLKMVVTGCRPEVRALVTQACEKKHD